MYMIAPQSHGIRNPHAYGQTRRLAVSSPPTGARRSNLTEGPPHAASLLDLRPDQVILVAAHERDLQGTQAAAVHTALIGQPSGATGPHHCHHQHRARSTSCRTTSLDLARQLGIAVELAVTFKCTSSR